MLVQGQVVDVVPLSGHHAALDPGPDCHLPKPARGADLIALLEWDLRVNCTANPGAPPAVSGYRVYYRWDGRTFSRVMREPPGDTISLRVRLE
jgi:hypothetical protein